jgi:hypothetical protein
LLFPIVTVIMSESIQLINNLIKPIKGLTVAPIYFVIVSPKKLNKPINTILIITKPARNPFFANYLKNNYGRYIYRFPFSANTQAPL